MSGASVNEETFEVSKTLLTFMQKMNSYRVTEIGADQPVSEFLLQISMSGLFCLPSRQLYVWVAHVHCQWCNVGWKEDRRFCSDVPA